jgi:hypothetical protein
MTRPSLLFVIPAWQRVELSTICFRQHSQMLETLRGGGIDAQAVVIADDDNLDAAQAVGLLTLERPNQLGAKWNVGYEYAGRAAFDYVAALGSDSWYDPPEPALPEKPDAMLCTRNYTVIDQTGTRQSHLCVRYEGGLGTRIMPTSMLKKCGYRPLEPGRDRYCDTATLEAIKRTYGRVTFEYSDRHPFEIVGFFSDVQLTPYRLLLQYWLVEHHDGDAFAGLEEHYPAGLVAAIRRHYASVGRSDLQRSSA